MQPPIVGVGMVAILIAVGPGEIETDRTIDLVESIIAHEPEAASKIVILDDAPEDRDLGRPLREIAGDRIRRTGGNRVEHAEEHEHGGVSRVRRGGCWADEGWPCRSAFRLRFEPERRHDHIGFRVVAVRP